MLPAMSGHERFWREIHACFDPMEPVGIEQPGLHVARDSDYNPIARLERQVSVPTRDRCRFLLTGAIGNGKSSELNHLAGRLAGHRIVILFDIYDHLQSRVRDAKALDRLQMWELLGLIGLAIYRGGQERLGHKWKDEPRKLEKALGVLREADAPGSSAEIDVVALARGMTVAAGGVAGAVLGGPLGAAAGRRAGESAMQAGKAVVKAVAEATDWSWKLGLFDNKVRGDQDGEVKDVLNAVNGLIMSLQQDLGRPLLLVIDGLDRIRESERIRSLFIESSMLAKLVCDLVLTAPLELMRRDGPEVEQFVLTDLHNVPVLDRDDPRKSGSGLGFFRELVERRVELVRQSLARDGLLGPKDPFPEEIVDRFAYYCGGLTREFVAMIRGASLEALIDGREQIDDEIVERVLREERRRKEYYMDKDQIAVLEAIMCDPKHELPGGDLAVDLLREKRLLAYPNKTTWYYPHPLLTLALLDPQLGSPS